MTTLLTYDFGPAGTLQPLKPLKGITKALHDWEHGALRDALSGPLTPGAFFELVDSMTNNRDEIGFPRYPRHFLDLYCADSRFKAAVGRYWREAHALQHAELMALRRTDMAWLFNLLGGALKTALYMGIGAGLLTVIGQAVNIDIPTAGALLAIFLMLWIFDCLMSATLFMPAAEWEFRWAREQLERLKLERARDEARRGG